MNTNVHDNDTIYFTLLVMRLKIIIAMSCASFVVILICCFSSLTLTNGLMKQLKCQKFQMK